MPRLLTASAIAGDAVADAVDAAELLGVDVDQLAGLLALVADARLGAASRRGRDGAAPADRRDGPPRRRAIAGPDKRWRRRRSISASAAAQPVRPALRPRRAVLQAGRAFGREAVAPLAHRLGRRPRTPPPPHCTVQPEASRSTISSRLRGVVLAFS